MHCRLLTEYVIIMVQFLAGLRKIKFPPGKCLFIVYKTLSLYLYIIAFCKM